MTVKNTIKVLFLVLLPVMLIGCGNDDDASTDDPDDTETEMMEYSLDAALAETVTVTLLGDGTATVELMLDPAAPESDKGDEELEAMIGDTISLDVINDETSTTYNLTEGTLVDADPSAAGEFAVSLSKDRATFTVTFANDFDGTALVVGGDYSAAISVTANDNYFTVESFTRQVEVTE